MSYDAPRLDLSDNLQDAIIKFADGNPGAINALLILCTQSPSIDPDSAFGPFSPLMSLDNLDVYGSDVYILLKDVCGNSPAAVLALLRAHQLGFVTEATIKQMIADGQYRRSPAPGVIDEYMKQVRIRLPNFKG